MGLRNRVEHRYENAIASLVAGRTQAYLLNYERTLVELFGPEEAMAEELRFPLFLSTLTMDATEALRHVRAQVPRGVLEWVQDFDTALDPDISSAETYDFRVYLIPHKGPKSEADAAMTFVDARDLSPEQNEVMDQVRTIIRDRKVPVSDLGNLRPGQVVERVAAVLQMPFKMHHHTQAWRYFAVRPANGAADVTKTKADFCRYNEVFDQYVYTEAWVKYLIRKLADPEIYDVVETYRKGDADDGTGGGT